MIWMCFSIGWWFPNLYLHRKCQRKWPQVDPFELNWWGFETFQVVSWLRKFYGPHTFSWLIDGSTVRVFCPNFLRFISGWRWKCFFCTTENMNMFPKTTWNHFSRNLSSSKLPTIDFQGIFVSYLSEMMWQMSFQQFPFPTLKTYENKISTKKTNILDVQLGIHLQPGPFSSQPLLSFRVLKVWVPMI